MLWARARESGAGCVARALTGLNSISLSREQLIEISRVSFNCCEKEVIITQHFYAAQPSPAIDEHVSAA